MHLRRSPARPAAPRSTRTHQLAPSYKTARGVPSEQYLLVQGVREEFRLNPDEAMHWYRRARISIADHPDALAVWEYLDR